MICRVCDSTDLEPVVDLGQQPWCNHFLKPEEVGKEPFYPLRVVYCRRCTTAQLDYTVKKEIMFGDHTYLSGVTRSLSEHFRGVVQDVDRRLGPNGRARALFLLARGGRCSLVSSPHAIEEARRNIQLKHSVASEEFDSLVSELSVAAEATPLAVAWALEQSLPLEDAPILAAAVEAEADLLVTGDRSHFGRLYGRSLRGVRIAAPADALALVLSV